MSEWQDISTAPKDGSTILTWGRLHDDGDSDMGERPIVRVSRWRLQVGHWYSDCSGSHVPTHWQPLPSPPEAK